MELQGESSAANSPSAALSSSLAARFGWRDFCFRFSPTHDTIGISPCIELMSPRMSQFMALYRSTGLYRICPVTQQVLRSDLPINYSCDSFPAASPRIQELADLARAHELDKGVVFPLFGHSGSLSVLVLAGRMSANTKTQPDEMLNEIASPMVKMVSASREALKQMHASTLTKRELECCAWVSMGKTSWEIAQILDIKSRTVDFHICNSMRKLDCATRSQLVSRVQAIGLCDMIQPAEEIGAAPVKTEYALN